MHGKIISIHKTDDSSVTLQGESLVYTVQNQVVRMDGDEIWHILHHGASLFDGVWQIVNTAGHQPLAGSRYVSSSHQYGEDLKISVYSSAEDFFFRRLTVEADSWVLISDRGQTICRLETAPDTGQVYFRFVDEWQPDPFWPILCLLVFDRMILHC